jgi:hypothetical protein
MTLRNGASSNDEALRAAVLAAVEQYLAEEAAASSEDTAQGGRLRQHRRQPVRQPNLWRSLAWANTRFRHSRGRSG